MAKLAKIVPADAPEQRSPRSSNSKTPSFDVVQSITEESDIARANVASPAASLSPGTSPPPSFSSGSRPPSYRTSGSGDSPPSFSSGSRPPSYQASSSGDDGIGLGFNILNTNVAFAFPIKFKRLSNNDKKQGTNEGLKTIPEEPAPRKLGTEKAVYEKPAARANPTRPYRKYFILLCWFMIILVFVFAVIIYVLIVLVIRKSSDVIPVANSTATVFSTVTQTATITFSTVFAATASSTLTASTTFPTIEPVPTNPIGGFDSFEYGDRSGWMFYTDQQGNIRHIQSYDPTSSETRNWFAASPEVMASGVKPGSAVQVATTVDFYNRKLSNFHVFYVAKDNKIQEMTTTSTSVGSGYNAWSIGTLGSLNIKTSDSMFLRVCIPWRTSRDYGNTTADLYLYYSSTDGGIKKLGWWDGNPSRWMNLTDLPQTNTRGVIECQNDIGGLENAWIVDDQQQLMQLTHNSTINSFWAVGAKLNSTVHPDSSILSVTSTLVSLSGRTHVFYQDTNNTIYRLDVNGHGTNSTIMMSQVVDQGTPGTRLATSNATSGNCGYGSTVIVYYQRNTSEIMQYSFSDDPYTGYAATISKAIPIAGIQTYGDAPASSQYPNVPQVSSGVISGIVIAIIFAIVAAWCWYYFC